MAWQRGADRDFLVGAAVDKTQALKEPLRRASLSGKMEVYKGMLRPWLEKPDAMLGHAA